MPARHISFEIEPEVADAAPHLTEIIVTADIKNPPTSDALWAEISAAAASVHDTTPMEMVNKRPSIAAIRAAYKALGKEPNRYRPSSEALCRRCVKGLELYRSLAVIDLINLISIVTGHSIGGFDLDKVQGDVVRLGVGREGEPYEAISRGPLNIHCLPVIRDAVGGIGTPTSDNERTKLSPQTTALLMTIHLYSGSDDADLMEDLTRRLLTDYADARNISFTRYTQS